MAETNPIAIPPRVKDLTGKRFNRWTVLEYRETRRSSSLWLCRCDCGTEAVVRSANIANGSSQSCGCLHRENFTAANTTHGQSGTPEHVAWKQMLNRCYNPNNHAYDKYGGRGIRVCDQWRKSFGAFIAYIGPRPSPTHSIDRYPDKNGNYEPGNCRWATKLEQSRNTRANVLVTLDGKTQCVTEWAEELGINPRTLRARLNRGWSTERSLTEPVSHCRASASSATPEL